MSNFFEQELRKLFEDGTIIQSPSFTGRACLGTLGQDLRVRAQFVTTGYADHYDTLRITVLNRTDGPVDTLSLKLSDVWGANKKDRSGNPIKPYIWVYRDEIDWYSYHPTQTDREKLKEEVKQYLEPFRDAERSHDGLKLVYICAPLQGDIEKNINFARQKAKEEFQSGSVPICPHLMFPPFADATDPKQDQAAREMGLRLVEVCQEVHVYGSEWTDGMWAEIRHAIDLGIVVKTDQKTIGRSQPHRQAPKKGGTSR